MKKLYQKIGLYGVLVMISGAIGCHQEPLVPQSAIPITCRINQLITINEGVRDTTTYLYNAFGFIEKSTYRQWVNGQLANMTDRNLTYTADHYLFSQVDRTATLASNGALTQLNKGYIYTYQDGRLQQVAIINNTSNAKIGFNVYAYDGDKLKTYTESDGNQKLIRRYTFDAAGKLIGYEEPNSIISSSLDNGKIVKRTFLDSSVATYNYDSEGQLTQQTLTTAGSQSQYTYTYDTNLYWSKTQLRLRGIPSPDLGESVQIHNLKQFSFKRYQGNKSVGGQTFTYNHVYNKEGYSLGYGRSDGVRQVNYYSNCP